MKFENKIEELLVSGKITPEQAQALRRSLQNGVSIESGQGFHRAMPIVPMAIGLIGIVLVLFFVGMSGSSQQTETIQNVAQTYNQPGGVGEMNKSMTTSLSILLLALPAIIWFIASYNGLVNKEENVLSAWAQVESNYQRRSDLIPALVKTVNAYVEHEGSTMRDITKLRQQAAALQGEGTKANELSKGAVGKLNDENYMKSLSAAQQKVGDNLKSLMVQVEAYPNLRASDQFLELQGQVEGTENRINVARMAFNENVNIFNRTIRRVPGSLLAGLGNFHRKAYFQSDEGTNKAAKMDFSSKAQ